MGVFLYRPTGIYVTYANIDLSPMATLLFRSAVFFLLLLFQLPSSSAGVSSRSVKHLPGFSGPLPFELETGYVGVGEREEIQLFYYFVKSEGNPKNDPLIVWLTGGPGCSSVSGFAFENGPLNFKIEEYNGSLPQLQLNPYSWTKNCSIIFLDSPVGSGFSYGKTLQSLNSGDLTQVHHIHQFVRKWLIEHPEFTSNPFYVGGDSYSGITVPAIAYEILEGNEHILPAINLQGYILGNPVTDTNTNDNYAIPFAHSMTLISDELFESLTSSCKGEYMNIDPSNTECLRHYDTYEKTISEINIGHILFRHCPPDSAKPQGFSRRRRSLYNSNQVLEEPKPPLPTLGCPTYPYVLGSYWLNNNQVREALHIREGTIGEWIRCNLQGEYTYDITNSVPYHANLSSRGCRSLIYSGDHDFMVPTLNTLTWIKSLNYPIVKDWRPWFIKDQVGGYTRTYANGMTFATIKGGGHTADYAPEPCSVVFRRWITNNSL
uniref:Serine carboxypeptidase-like 7 n=1 Tax=Cucumis melo TaxID=3656 RepID=A0A9I9DDI4_CUCME